MDDLRVSARPAPPLGGPAVAPGAGASAAQQQQRQAAVPAPAPKPAPNQAPPPPPPEGFDMDVQVGIHEATNLKIYNFVDPGSGKTVVQIPIEAVLDMVADILRQLEAEGKR